MLRHGMICWAILQCCLSLADEPLVAQPQRTVVRKQGDDGVHTYRIPGLATSPTGTLLAVFDLRHRSAVDLPGDIDVGLMRSTDHGQTWGKLQTIIDFDKNVADAKGNGVGDPTILVDHKTGTIWVAALWSQGNRAWNGSAAGVLPTETGQLVLVKSTDDGLTWSQPINITTKIHGRDPKWRLLFNGPGRGIQLADGTLILPAQFRDAQGVPHSCFLWSTDPEQQWTISLPAIPQKPPTSESQIVAVGDRKLLLSMRDESRSGQRAWADFTWDKQLSDGQWGAHRSALPDPTCMASIIAADERTLIFANPNSAKSRVGMTLRASHDQGLTWSTGRLLDPRPSSYSCLTMLKTGEVGIMYETGDKGANETLTFARFPVSWIEESK